MMLVPSRRLDVADIGDPFAHDDLAAAEAIEISDGLDPVPVFHLFIPLGAFSGKACPALDAG